MWDPLVKRTSQLAWITGATLATSALVAAVPRSPGDAPARPAPVWYLQSNLAGGWADGAEARGIDDVVASLADHIAALATPPRAVFLNEACESHGVQLAARLGPDWRAFFVQAWPGHSDCFPAPGATEGRYGNAVVVRDANAAPLLIPSCNDPGSAPGLCLPNWVPPAEQRRGSCATSQGDLLCAVHLDPGSWQWHDDQLRAIGRIAAALAADHDSIVVGGDLNDGRGDVHRAFTVEGPVRFVDLAGDRRLDTYPAAHPTRDLDHLLFGTRGSAGSGGARAIDLGFCTATFQKDGRCTDHLALLAAVVIG